MGYIYNKEVTYSASCNYGKYRYYSSNTVNGLFRIELESGKVQYVSMFKGESAIKPFMHVKAFEISGKIVFVPRYSKYLSVFDPLTNNVENYLLDTWEGFRGADACVYGGKIWIFLSGSNHGIMIVDAETFELEKTIKYNDTVLKGLVPKGHDIFINTICFEGRYAYAVIGGTNYCACIDLHSEQIKLIELEDETLQLCCNTICNDKLYLSAYNSTDIIEYNLENKSQSVYVGDFTICTKRVMKFVGIFSVNSEVIILPEVGKEVYHLNYETQMVEKYGEIPKDFEEIALPASFYWRRYYTAEVSNDLLHISPFKGTYEIIVSPKAGTVSGIKYKLDDKQFAEVYEDFYCKQYIDEKLREGIVYETESCGLNEMINRLN